MSKFKNYTLKGRRGIDDLQGIYAFVGNSQGNTSGSNDIEDYKSSGGWMSFVFKCEMTEEAIKAESEKRIKENAEYVDRLIKEGKFGEEYDINVSVQENEIFDAPQKAKSYSYKAIIFDTNN